MINSMKGTIGVDARATRVSSPGGSLTTPSSSWGTIHQGNAHEGVDRRAIQEVLIQRHRRDRDRHEGPLVLLLQQLEAQHDPHGVGHQQRHEAGGDRVVVAQRDPVGEALVQPGQDLLKEEGEQPRIADHEEEEGIPGDPLRVGAHDGGQASQPAPRRQLTWR
jgi:hypothetical protein